MGRRGSRACSTWPGNPRAKMQGVRDGFVELEPSGHGRHGRRSRGRAPGLGTVHPVALAVAESLTADALAQAFTVYRSMRGSVAEAPPAGPPPDLSSTSKTTLVLFPRRKFQRSLERHCGAFSLKIVWRFISHIYLYMSSSVSGIHDHDVHSRRSLGFGRAGCCCACCTAPVRTVPEWFSVSESLMVLASGLFNDRLEHGHGDEHGTS